MTAKPLKGLIFFLISIGLCSPMKGQEADSTSVETTESQSQDNLSIEPLALNSHRFGVILHGGAIGYGLDVAYNINPHLNVRAGLNLFNISGIEVPYTIDERDVNIVLANNALSFEVMAEYLPWQSSSFKIVGGLGYISEFTGEAQIMVNEPLMFGEIEIRPEDIGQLNLQLQYQGLAPYLGIGFGRSVPKKRVGFGFELGTYYVGSPSVSMTGTELLEPSANEDQEQAFEDAFSSLQWLPNLKLRLAIRI
jgi:hypothetical protein